MVTYPADKANILPAMIFLHQKFKMIHSKNDHVISFRHALLFKKYLKNKFSVEIIFVENLAHGATIPNHQKLIMDFFEKNLN